MTALYWTVEYLVSFVETLMCFVFCGSFLNKQKRFVLKQTAFICLFLAGSIILLGQIQLFSAVNTAVTFIVVFFSIKLYYKARFLRTIITFVSFYTVLFTADLVTAAFTSSVASTTISELFSEFSLGRLIASLTSKCILSIICITFYRIANQKSAFSARFNIVFSVLSIALLFISVSLFINYSRNDSKHTNFTLCVFFIIILMLVVAIFISITYFFDSQQRKNEYDLSQKQAKFLERSLKEQENTFSLWRKSIHDYKNTVLALQAMLQNGEIEKVSEYLEKESTAFMHRSEYIRTGNDTADIVINSKLAVAKEKGILYTVNAVMPTESDLDDIQFATVLGNLIDNAIEASEKETEPFIDIEIATIQAFLIIKIVNKCTNPPINNESTKKDKLYHGIGLKSVKQFVETYGGDFSLSFEDGQATAKIMIKI